MIMPSLQVRIRKELLAITDLHRGLEGYRILHLSDLHFNQKVKNDQELWNIIHSGDIADLLLITGDFITYSSYIDPLVEYLKDSRFKDGTFAILGNHDYAVVTLKNHFRHLVLRQEYVPNDWKRLLAMLEHIGIKVLINQHAVANTAEGSSIFIEGTDDPVRGEPRIAEQNSEYDSSDFKILMSHSPDILYSEMFKVKKFDLLLSGHTHGGQIRIPGIGPLLTATKYAKRKEAYGAYRTETGIFVNVSAGIGYSLLPIRLNCPSEVTLIELTRFASVDSI